MSAPAKSANDEIISLYSALMEEIKLRIETINVLAGGKTGLEPIVVQEACFLQLRLICELIALGCLTAHGDIKETKATKFRKTYEADKILKGLEELHADFYPIPTRVLPKEEGKSVQPLELVKEGDFLKKSDLFTLYGQTGNFLHRGSMKKLLSQERIISPSYAEISKWAKKIVDLLSMHTIARLSGNPLICVMKNTMEANRLTVSIYGPGPPSPR